MRGVPWLALIAAALPMVPAVARPTGALRIDRVVVVMRHGVRPPTKMLPLPAGTATQPWPVWPVAPGWLTPHGAAAIGVAGAADGVSLRAAGVLPRGCPAAAAVAIVADSDERTIATAERWAAAALPGCAVAIDHRPQGQDDPRFSPIGQGVALDASTVDAAVATAAGPGGVVAVARAQAPLLRRLDAILCGTAVPVGCGVARFPTTISPARPDARPKLGGALDLASTAAQVLLLEYADAKPAGEVGWGRASAADVARLSRFHALEFALVARPRPIARANLALLSPGILATLGGRGEARVLIYSAHDTQVANLAGLLDAHWRIPGFAADDPAPGGALILERVVDRRGKAYVRVFYRAQPLEAIRSGGSAMVRQRLTVPGCADPSLCTLDEMTALLG